jgi:HK97 gp10 family phage protein
MSIKVVTKSNWKGDIIKIKGKSAMKESIFQIGLIVEGQAKELCARRYGYLAASINTQFEGGGTELESPSTYAKETPPTSHKINTFRKIQKPGKENVVLVGTAVDYGPHVEFGTVKMSAQPFLRPAADLAQGKTLNIVKTNSKYEFQDYIK